MSVKSKIKNIINAVVRRSYWYNNVLFPDCKKFWLHKTFNLDVVNLGSTSGLNAFNYDGINLKCANWALGHNPIIADFEVLKNYYSFLNPNGSTVIITLCPFTSLSGSYDYFEDRYYTILRMSSIPNCSIRRKMQVLNMRNNPIQYLPIFQLYVEFKNVVKKLLRRNTLNSIPEYKFEQDSSMWIRNWLKEFSVEDFSAPLSMHNQDGVEDAANTINEMITFCKERNMRPVLIIPPMHNKLAKKFTSQARTVIIDSLLSKINDKSVYFHNYMNEEYFTNDTSLFQNSFLLNEKGAKLFTQRVLKDLKLI